MNATDETKETKKLDLAHRVAKLLSELLSDQFDAKITIILEGDEHDKKDEPTEGENK